MVQIFILKNHFQHLYTCINQGGREPWFFTIVYASSNQAKREDLWNNLHGISRTMDKPWLVADDFNEIRDPCDKKLGSPFN